MPLGLVSALRSVDIGLADVAAAESFFTDIWNLRVTARDLGVVYLRGSGADHHLLALHPRARSELVSVTLRATSAEALDRLAEQALAHGGAVVLPRHRVSEPGGGEAVVLRDPQGRILRFVFGDERHVDTTVGKDQPIQLAHAVLNSHDVAAGLPFYENALGMRLSDRTRIMAFVRIPQDGPGDHHSVALADADNDCLNHIAFVMPDVDAVMRGGGRMKDAGYAIEWGPGRHGPGDNAFNYFVGPGGYVIEYTSDIEQVDDNYRVGNPDDWKWPPGRVDQWGISPPPSQVLKHAQRQIAFAPATA
ncbi:VOC family protein [Comamonadaceae bacterium G21597-S1]|nr:VOC family protein [Comamonadaceae bacterium G21597-S1]